MVAHDIRRIPFCNRFEFLFRSVFESRKELEVSRYLLKSLKIVQDLVVVKYAFLFFNSYLNPLVFVLDALIPFESRPERMATTCKLLPINTQDIRVVQSVFGFNNSSPLQLFNVSIFILIKPQIS